MNLPYQSAPLSTESKIQSGTVADWRQAELAKWRPYAGAAPTGQAVAAMKTPHAHWLAYSLHPRLLASPVRQKPSAAPPPLLLSVSSSPSSLATTKLLPLASPELCRLPPYLLDMFSGPNELR